MPEADRCIRSSPPRWPARATSSSCRITASTRRSAFPPSWPIAQNATAWALAHLAGIGGDPARVFLMGHSAGAYNALMLALDAHYLADAGTSRDRLAGAIGLAGPYDFLPITGPEVRAVFAPVDDGPASQPITYVDRPRPAFASPGRLCRRDGEAAQHPGAGPSPRARSRRHCGRPHLPRASAISAWSSPSRPLFQGKAPVLADVDAFCRRTQPHAWGETLSVSGSGAQVPPAS